MIRVVLLLFALTIPDVCDAYCSPGWKEFKGFCYSVSDEALSWFDAISTCNIYGGRVAQVDSQERQDFLANEIKSLNHAYVWIGATSRLHPATWEWIPSGKVLAFQNWYPGEPNSGATYRCALMYSGYNYKWIDGYCSSLYNFICEKKVK